MQFGNRKLQSTAALVLVVAYCCHSCLAYSSQSSQNRLVRAGGHSNGISVGTAYQHNPIEFYRAAYVLVGEASSASLTVNETTLQHSGQWVETCWKGITFPASDDYVALIVPANASLSETAPAKYQWAAMDPKHLQSGSGCLRFRLLNMRQDVRFVFLRNGFSYPTVAAKSERVSVANPNEPTGGHLALTSKPGEMLVQWTTLNAAHPVAKWGKAAGKYEWHAAAETDTYSRQDMCGGPAAREGWVEPGYLHRALLTGLEPDSEYFYIYGDKDGGWSQEASFVTPPPVAADSSVSFLAIADMGQAEVDGSNENGFGEQHPSLATVRGLLKNAEGRRLVIHNGDISYARGYGSQWEVFQDQIEPVARRMPWMTVAGNHERDWPDSGDRYGTVTDSGGECGVSYDRRMRMPRKSAVEPWYSFDFGPIHFLQYDTELPFHPGSPQHRFIVEDLKSVNRSWTPWVIVGGHRPMYIDSTNWAPVWGDQTVAEELRVAFEKELVKYEVDMTWHGHHHSYQRTCPAYDNECRGYHNDESAAAPVHVVIGNAGAELCWNIEAQQPNNFEVVEVAWGYMKVDANATHLTCEAINDLEEAGTRVLDKFTLQKPLGWRPRLQRGAGGGGSGVADGARSLSAWLSTAWASLLQLSA